MIIIEANERDTYNNIRCNGCSRYNYNVKYINNYIHILS